MANTNKVTVVDKFNALIALLEENQLSDEAIGDTTVKAFLEDRRDKSTKASTAKGKFNLNDEQKSIVDEVIEVLTAGGNTPMIITDIQKKSDMLGAFTTSKIASAVSKMTINAEKNPNPNGVFIRTMDKKSAKYALAKVEASADDTEDEE